MNLQRPTIAPPGRPLTAAPGRRMGIGFNFPVTAPAYQLRLDCVWLFNMVLHGLEAMLKRECLISKLHSSGDFLNGWAELETNQPDQALEIIHAWRDNAPLINQFSCVGWYCPAEEEWRLTRQSVVPVQLNTFHFPERVADRLAVMKKAGEFLEQIIPPS